MTYRADGLPTPRSAVAPAVAVRREASREASTARAFIPMASPYVWAFRAFYVVYFLSLVVVSTYERVPNQLVLVGALLLATSLAAAPFVFWHPSFGWFHPLVFQSILFSILLARRFPMYARGLDFHKALPTYPARELNRLLAQELVLTALGFAFYYIGFFVSRGLVRSPFRFRRPRHLSLVVLLSFVVGGTVFAIYLTMQGGLVAHMLSWSEGRRQELAGDFIFFILTAPSICAVWLWLANDLRALRKPLFWCAAFAALGFQFFLMGGRSAIVLSVGAGFSIYVLRRGRVPFLRAALLPVIAIYGVGVLGYLRNSTHQGDVDFGGSLELTAQNAVDLGTTELEVRTTSASGTLPILARVPSQIRHLHGESYFAGAVALIPRRLWKDKPDLIGGRVGRVFFHTSSGVPPGAVGEAYWNFNVYGVALIFLAFGALHRLLHRILTEDGKQPAAVVLVVLILIFFRVPATPAYVSTLFQLIPLFAVLLGTSAIRWGTR